MIRSSKAEFSFPVLGITLDRDLWGFHNRDELNTCGRQTLRDKLQQDMELVDAVGARWRVLGVHRIGGVGLSLGLSCFLARVSRIDQDLERLAPFTLEQVKERVCSCMRDRPEDWIWPDVTLEQRLAEVTGLDSIAGVHDVLGLDHFRAY